MDKYEQVKASKKSIITNNLLGGVAWGIGATVGATMLLAILGFILSKFDTAPFVGDYVSQVARYVDKAQDVSK